MVTLSYFSSPGDNLGPTFQLGERAAGLGLSNKLPFADFPLSPAPFPSPTNAAHGFSANVAMLQCPTCISGCTFRTRKAKVRAHL